MLGGLSRRWRSRTGVIEDTLSRLEFVIPEPGDDRTRVAVVQMAYRAHADPADGIAQCHALALAAARAGARLVCFPEQTPLALLQALGEGALADDMLAGDWQPRAWHSAFPALYRLYRGTFARLARGFGIAIAAGAVHMPGGDDILTAHLFAADGRLLLRQPISPDGRRGGLGLGGGREQTPVVAAGGCRLAFLPAGDAVLAGLVSAAVRQGAELLIVMPGLSTAEAPPPGGAALAEACGAYVACAGILAAGRQQVRRLSGIYAPPALTEDDTGVLAAADGSDGEAVLVATLHPVRLRAWRLPGPAVTSDAAASSTG